MACCGHDMCGRSLLLKRHAVQCAALACAVAVAVGLPQELGLKPEDVITKVMANPELAAGFSNPKVQAAIIDISGACMHRAGGRGRVAVVLEAPGWITMSELPRVTKWQLASLHGIRNGTAAFRVACPVEHACAAACMHDVGPSVPGHVIPAQHAPDVRGMPACAWWWSLQATP